MALASFADGSYLEAIAVQPKADPKALDRHEWAPFLKEDAAPCGWAVQTRDLAADREHLKPQASRFRSLYAPGGDGRMECAWSGRRRISGQASAAVSFRS